MNESMREDLFHPYIEGEPFFKLSLYELGQDEDRPWKRPGKEMVGYKLEQMDGDSSQIIFEGTDFGCSPLHAIDSDAAVEAIMNFLTVRPGDTDADYFEKYTDAQLEFANQHAESLNAIIESVIILH
jgi:hypothetical protein